MFSAKTHSPSDLFSRLLLCLFLVCLTTPFLAPIHALAFADPIHVTTQTDSVSFPQSIDFQMTAHDSIGVLTQATIFIQFGDKNGKHEQHRVMAPKAGTTVTFRWHEDITGNNFTPTGSHVSYYWQLLDNAGNLHIDTTQTFTVIDSRFTWQHATQGLLQINWYNRPAGFGQAVLHLASTHVSRISNDLGSGLKQPISLWIYQSNDDFHNSLPPNESEWVGGIAFPELDVASIVVDSLNDDTLVRDMPHEITHLIFHQIKNPSVPVPRWFDEGLAVYHQVYHEPEMSTTLKKALDKRALLPLDSIANDFPADANKAYLAYAESWNLLDYMYTTFDHAKMVLLMKDLGNARTDFNQDLQQALGIDEAHLENQWHLHLNQPPTLTAEQAIESSQLASQHIHVTTTDTSAPYLFFLGILLVILPAFGIGYLLVYQRRSRMRTLMAMQAGYHLQNNTGFSSPPAAYRGIQSAYPPQFPHTDLGRHFPTPPGAQTPFPPAPQREFIDWHPDRQAPRE